MANSLCPTLRECNVTMHILGNLAERPPLPEGNYSLVLGTETLSFQQSLRKHCPLCTA